MDDIGGQADLAEQRVDERRLRAIAQGRGDHLFCQIAVAPAAVRAAVARARHRGTRHAGQTFDMHDLYTLDPLHRLDAFADDGRQVFDQRLLQRRLATGVRPQDFGGVQLFLAARLHAQAFFQRCHGDPVGIGAVLCYGLFSLGQNADACRLGLRLPD